MSLRAAALALLAVVAALACGRVASLAPRGARTDAGARLARAEALFAELRAARDLLDVTVARGEAQSEHGLSTDSLRALVRVRLAAVREALATLDAGDDGALSADDRRALATMRSIVARMASPAVEVDAIAPCGEDPRIVAARAAGLHAGAEAEARARLSAHLYRCYGDAARQVAAGGEVLDRLTILARLSREPDAAERKRLFLALQPVWRSVNGDGTTLGSPYRTLLALSAGEWRRSGAPPAEAARALAIAPDSIETWLVRVLERWRDATGYAPVEPWDWWHASGAASRRLDALLPLARMREVNAAYHRSLGADLDALQVRWDLEPRAGKSPVAFSTFERRGRRATDGWMPTVPWVFATYREGGLDNLNELVHETGHAIHLAAIRTRPAFLDWPDSDALSEAFADVLAREIYEPAWQRRWLGDAAPLEDGLRARYAPVMLDMAWALLELRLHADPSRDPNAEWTRLTHEYLRILPHPELSWWAMRGQLVDVPGYMANYALGAIVIADLRGRMRSGRGPLTGDDPGWYQWTSAQLFRFGLESSSRETVQRFLGRPVSPDALLGEIDRLRAAGAR